MPEGGVIEGTTVRARSIALAGWLSERGVGEIVLNGVRHVARSTDLPGEIDSALDEHARVLIEGGDVRVEITPDECVWGRKPATE